MNVAKNTPFLFSSSAPPPQRCTRVHCLVLKNMLRHTGCAAILDRFLQEIPKHESHFHEKKIPKHGSDFQNCPGKNSEPRKILCFCCNIARKG